MIVLCQISLCYKIYPMNKTRANQFKNFLLEKKLDAALISNYYNIYYLSNFKTLSPEEREAWLLVTKNNSYLFTDGRYFDHIKHQISMDSTMLTIEIFKLKLIASSENLTYHLKKIIKEEKIKSIGFETEDLKFFEYQKFKDNLLETELIPTEKLIIKLREIKDEEEIKKIKKACQITDGCLKEIIKTIKIGQTEKEIAFKIEYWLKEKGYSLAFYPIVAADKNSAIPHYDTEGGFGKIKNGSIIIIDFGANYKNYLSDISRTVFVGKPKTEILTIYSELLTIQQNTMEYLKKESDPKKIDSFCRRSLLEKHLPIYPHSTGHGVGLEIHEYPKISQTSLDTIQKNQVFTIEPGIYFEGKFGVRVEDSVWMRNDFQPKILTQFIKKPIFLG